MNGRRDFRRGLVTLPLVGGAVSLIGRPSAVAVPVSHELSASYTRWLAIELGESLIERTYLKRLRVNPDHIDWAVSERDWRRQWCREMPFLNCFSSFDTPPETPPSTRAALVLSTIGCDWRPRGV